MEERTFQQSGITWVLPDILQAPGPRTPLGRFQFENWCRDFVRANIQQALTLARDYYLPVKAFVVALGLDGLEPGVLADHDNARASTSTITTSIAATPAELSTAIEHRRIAWESLCSGAVAKLVCAELNLAWPDLSKLVGAKPKDAPPELGPHTLSQQEKAARIAYFPDVAGNQVFCLSCAAFGHCTTACPLPSCTLCDVGQGAHTAFGCPKLQTTTATTVCALPKKHQTPNTENRRPLPSLSMVSVTAPTSYSGPSTSHTCIHCSISGSHAPGNVCPTLWQTVVPSPVQLRSTKRLRMSCYVCGDASHFGGDCALNTGKHLSGRWYARGDDIWKASYCSQFTALAPWVDNMSRLPATAADPDPTAYNRPALTSPRSGKPLKKNRPGAATLVSPVGEALKAQRERQKLPAGGQGNNKEQSLTKASKKRKSAKLLPTSSQPMHTSSTAQATPAPDTSTNEKGARGAKNELQQGQPKKTRKSKKERKEAKLKAETEKKKPKKKKAKKPKELQTEAVDGQDGSTQLRRPQSRQQAKENK